MVATARFTQQIVVGLRPHSYRRLLAEAELRRRSVSATARLVLEKDYPGDDSARIWHTLCVPEIRPARVEQIVILVEPRTHERMCEVVDSVPGLTLAAVVRQTIERAFPDLPIGD